MLTLQQVAIAYGAHTVVRELSFSLDEGRIGCLIGPSGCGKTTALRAIAGFEPVQSGEVRLRDSVVADATRAVPPEQRNVGMVFQDLALFPHLTVAQNVAFGLSRLDRESSTRRVAELLDVVGMAEYGRRYIHELSGGQQQRVALARALAPRPSVLLLDEPFSSLDADLREALAKEVRAILKREGITAVMVTHDQSEAFAMADVIGVMNKGRLLQWATPYDLYHQPADRFVADFIGGGVLLPGRVLADGHVQTSLGALKATGETSQRAGAEVDVLVRPDDIVHDDASGVTARVMEKAFRGSHILYSLEVGDGDRVQCLARSHHDHAIGERIGIRLELDHVILFSRE